MLIDFENSSERGFAMIIMKFAPLVTLFVIILGAGGVTANFHDRDDRTREQAGLALNKAYGQSATWNGS